jgi:hypothetical protein
MCYSGCPHENYDGECRKKSNQLCPDDFDDERSDEEIQDDYESALIEKYESDLLDKMESDKL